MPKMSQKFVVNERVVEPVLKDKRNCFVYVAWFRIPMIICMYVKDVVLGVCPQRMNILTMVTLMKEIKLHVETVVERFCNSFVIEFTSNAN